MCDFTSSSNHIVVNNESIDLLLDCHKSIESDGSIETEVEMVVNLLK